jgi:hypothetical protein
MGHNSPLQINYMPIHFHLFHLTFLQQNMGVNTIPSE